MHLTCLEPTLTWVNAIFTPSANPLVILVLDVDHPWSSLPRSLSPSVLVRPSLPVVHQHKPSLDLFPRHQPLNNQETYCTTYTNSTWLVQLTLEPTQPNLDHLNLTITHQSTSQPCQLTMHGFSYYHLLMPQI
jgi:hypothetical protein